MKFELDLFSKKGYFWTETKKDGSVVISNDYPIREEMIRAMRKAFDACRENGTVFQPMVRQNGQAMEWGNAETVDRHFILVNDNDEEIADLPVLGEAVDLAKTYNERVRVMDKERSKIFYIKE